MDHVQCNSVDAGDGIEGLSELPPEQAVVKLQRQNARLRRKAEAAMAIEQENANLKTQLHDLATHMVRFASLCGTMYKASCSFCPHRTLPMFFHV